MFSVFAFGIKIDNSGPLLPLILLSIGVIVFMLIYWLAPALIGVFIFNKVYKKFAINHPNNWLVTNIKIIIFTFIALIPILFIGFYIYRFIDTEQAQRRMANYQECIKENKIDVRKENNNSYICSKYLRKNWSLW